MNNKKFWEEIERIEEILGKENFLAQLEKAMGQENLENITAYICRMNDINTILKEKNK